MRPEYANGSLSRTKCFFIKIFLCCLFSTYTHSFVTCEQVSNHSRFFRQFLHSGFSFIGILSLSVIPKFFMLKDVSLLSSLVLAMPMIGFWKEELMLFRITSVPFKITPNKPFAINMIGLLNIITAIWPSAVSICSFLRPPFLIKYR